MATFISLFSPAQIAILNERCNYQIRQAASTTGYIVAGDEPGEFYLEDANALFRTNGVVTGDIAKITAGATSPLGEYTVAGNYYDPNIDAAKHTPSETRIILDGAPAVGGPITYTVYYGSTILSDLAQITESNSTVLNVDNPEILKLDAVFLKFFEQFDLICDLVTGTMQYLVWKYRPNISSSPDLDDAAAGVLDTYLFPTDWVELYPNRNLAYTPVPIDPFFVLPNPNLSERGGLNDEQAAYDAMSLLIPALQESPLTVAYNDALDKEEAALLNQDGFYAALETEVANNNTLAESGNLNAFYTALTPLLAAARASIVLRLADIAQIRLTDKRRSTANYPASPTPGYLNFRTIALAQAEVTAQEAVLNSAPFATFMDLRYVYLDLLVNRSYGTRTDYQANLASVNSDGTQRTSLENEMIYDRQLLQLP